jgi:hypothetical protein
MLSHLSPPGWRFEALKLAISLEGIIDQTDFPHIWSEFSSTTAGEPRSYVVYL